ncbi:DEAD/DEAH box helicase, partial [Streptomyces sp. SID5789]|nr:DEAD/DEAH box helicase [Streptomyces sp. SID5789]
ARTLLDRHGVVTRGAVAAEGVEGGFSAVYRILAAFEESGQARRGYVVEGLGAAQFAMEGAVDRLRAVANARERGDGSPGPTAPTPADVPPFADFPDFPDFDPSGDRGSDGRGGPGALTPDDDVFADPDRLGRSPSRGDYISPRDYAEPGAGGPRGGGAQGGSGGPRGQYGTGPNGTGPYGNVSYDTGFPGRRDRPATGPRAVVLAAADPANAYGAALTWPEPPAGATHKPGRKAGSLVVLVEGEPALYMERGGKTLLLWPSEPDAEAPPTDDARLHAAAEALAGAARAGSLGTVTVERVNGEAALTSPFGPLLEEAGFIATPRGLRIRA